MLQQGIYRLEGDTLTVSFGEKERSREFNSTNNGIRSRPRVICVQRGAEVRAESRGQS